MKKLTAEEMKELNEYIKWLVEIKKEDVMDLEFDCVGKHFVIDSDYYEEDDEYPAYHDVTCYINVGDEDYDILFDKRAFFIH